MDSPKLLQGIAASPGIAIGRAVVLDQSEDLIEEKNVAEEDIQSEIDRFKAAVQKSKEELELIRNQLKKSGIDQEAGIFFAQQLMLDDVIASAKIITQIKTRRKNAEFIFFETLKSLIETFTHNDSETIRERVIDLRDIRRRVLRNLTGKNMLDLTNIESHAILIAHDLTPSETAMFHKENIAALVTDVGGRSSHVSILARSLEIPAVVGTKLATRSINDGSVLIVDGINGKVMINPTPSQLKDFQHQKNSFLFYEAQLVELNALPSITKDAYCIELSANVEFSTEVETVMKYGGDGVGLFRTEFLYLTRSWLPTEEEQYQEYHYLAKKLHPKNVIIRTFDLGGDKYTNNINFPKESNPFLGWRAIRVSIDRHDIFIPQLRAILRASALGNVKIMFPMISGYAELKKVLTILEETKDQLRKENIPFNEEMETGIMIEIPSAVLVSDKLAELVDFFSIGTNDLTQYTLAVDRGNERIASMYNSLHPGVLRLIHQTIIAGHQKGIWVGMCGDLASNPLAIVLLIAMGIDELSVSPIFIPEVKQIIRSINYKQVLFLANYLREFSTADEIRQFLANYVDQNNIPINYRIWGDFFQ